MGVNSVGHLSVVLQDLLPLAGVLVLLVIPVLPIADDAPKDLLEAGAG